MKTEIESRLNNALYAIEAENPDQLEGVLKCINFDATTGRTRLSDQNQLVFPGI